MLQSHYSSTLDFSNDALLAAEKAYRRLNAALAIVKGLSHPGTSTMNAELTKELERLIDDCYKNMSDDFNTAKTLAVLFEMSSRINDFKSGNRKLSEIAGELFDRFKQTYIAFMEDVLGLQEESSHRNDLLDGAVKVLIDLRKKARTDRNYALSDKIRDDLKSAGIQLKDGKDGDMTYEIEN
jgi:cysteinyl-tRNA synthetase